MFYANTGHTAGKNLAFFSDIARTLFAVFIATFGGLFDFFCKSDVIDFINLVYAEGANFLFRCTLSSRSCGFSSLIFHIYTPYTLKLEGKVVFTCDGTCIFHSGCSPGFANFGDFGKVVGTVITGGEELYFVCNDFGNVSSYAVSVVIGAGLDGSAYANFRTFLEVLCAVFGLVTPANYGQEVGLLVTVLAGIGAVNGYSETANANV